MGSKVAQSNRPLSKSCCAGSKGGNRTSNRKKQVMRLGINQSSSRSGKTYEGHTIHEIPLLCVQPLPQYPAPSCALISPIGSPSGSQPHAHLWSPSLQPHRFRVL